jgi:hypothetical protein
VPPFGFRDALVIEHYDRHQLAASQERGQSFIFIGGDAFLDDGRLDRVIVESYESDDPFEAAHAAAPSIAVLRRGVTLPRGIGLAVVHKYR